MGYLAASDSAADYVLVHKDEANRCRELADELAVVRAQLAIVTAERNNLLTRAHAAFALWEGLRPLPPATDN
jgi:hypothetical protein